MHPLLRTLTATVIVGCALHTPNSPAGLAHAVASSPAALPAAHPSAAAAQNTAMAAPMPEPHATSGVCAGPAPIKPRLRRLPQKNVTRAIAREARRIIDAHGKDPFGTEIPFDAGGNPYVARIEQHYHPPGGDKRPWGPHPGVSVFVAGPPDASGFAAN